VLRFIFILVASANAPVCLPYRLAAFQQHRIAARQRASGMARSVGRREGTGLAARASILCDPECVCVCVCSVFRMSSECTSIKSSSQHNRVTAGKMHFRNWSQASRSENINTPTMPWCARSLEKCISAAAMQHSAEKHAAHERKEKVGVFFLIQREMNKEVTSKTARE
jgi:hypothetical protein